MLELAIDRESCPASGTYSRRVPHIWKARNARGSGLPYLSCRMCLVLRSPVDAAVVRNGLRMLEVKR